MTNQIFKVGTAAPEWDFAMAPLRSDAFNIVSHPAYKLKDSEAKLLVVSLCQ
jgi:hypothetical protein